MRSLVDACAGGRLAAWLRDGGHDAAEVRDRSSTMDDDEVLEWAVEEQRVVVTVDKDFGALAILMGQPHCGIPRLPDVPVPERRQMMDAVIAEQADDLAQGALITVERGRVRVRRG